MSLDPILRAQLAELGARLLEVATAPEDPPTPGSEPVWALLSAYGDTTTRDGAERAFQAAISDLNARGGGVLVVPADSSPEFRPRSSTDGVALIDTRGGQLRVLVGERARTWSNLGGAPEASLMIQGTLREPHYRYGSQSPLAVQQVNVHGGNSARCRLLEDVSPGPAARWYPNDPESIYVGQELYSEGAGAWIRVSALGWDEVSRRMYFEADCETPAPRGSIIGQKSNLGGFEVSARDHCRNQGHGLQVQKRQYADGDAFANATLLQYQCNITSCEGDEGGVGYAAEIVHDLQNFRATVDRWDPATRRLHFAAARRGYALAEGRPLINLNPSRWLAEGRVRIYNSNTYDGQVHGRTDGQSPIGGPWGVVVGVDTAWGPEIVGRYLAVDDPSEVLDPQQIPSNLVVPDTTLLRWFRIVRFSIDPDNSNQLLWIQHINGNPIAAAPKLVHATNYTNYGGGELAYRIAPGANVCDVRGGWSEDGDPDHGFVELTPHGDMAGPHGFQPGDPIEQAIGPQPNNPTAFRARHFNHLPSLFQDSSYYAVNHGSVSVAAGLFLNGHGTLADTAAAIPRGGVDYEAAVLIHASTDSAIRVVGESRSGNALLLEQYLGDRKWIAWGRGWNNFARLGYEPETESFVFGRQDGGGFGINLGGAQVRRVAGISGTSTPTGNLRGILVAVPTGATEIDVTLPMPEPDRAYAVTVTPSWPVGVGVSARGTAGFTVRFGGPAPEGATLDWVLVR